MNILVADENGLIHVIQYENNSNTSSEVTKSNPLSIIHKYGEYNRTEGIKSIIRFKNDQYLASFKLNGTIEILQQNQNSPITSICKFNTELNSPVVVQEIKGEGDGSSVKSFICGDETGKISLYKVDFDECIDVGSEAITNISDFQVKCPLSVVRTCLQGGIACGGKENDLQIYDINSGKSVWTAKNVPHDNLNLRCPIYITDIQFVRPNQDHVSDAHIITGTGYKQIRLYDIKTNKQPVMSFEISKDYRVTCVQPFKDGKYIYVGNTAGDFSLWDVRMTGRMVNSLKGCTGSIRSISLNESETKIACVGLDRHLRVYNAHDESLNSTLHAAKLSQTKGKFLYLKNRLNVCLLSGEDAFEQKRIKKIAKDVARDRQRLKDSELNGTDDMLENYQDSDDDDDESEINVNINDHKIRQKLAAHPHPLDET
eukprot:gene6035-8309_t